MPSVITRNLALFGGMVLAGLVCVQAAPFVESVRGAGGPTLFSAERPGVAAVAVILCLALASMIACIVGRMVNAAVGVFVLGAGVFALDSRLATVRELAFVDAGRAALIKMAVETLVLACAAFVMVHIVFRVTGGLHDVEADEHNERPHWLTSPAALKSAACGVLVLPAVWLTVQSPMKGQALAGAIIGGTLAGLIARLLAPHVQPLLVLVSPMVFGALGQLLAAFATHPPLDHAYIDGTLSVFARATPMDYLAGSLLGVPMGLGWAKSFLHHEDAPVTRKA
jgi:large-conductance mechanosensitive channel